LISLCFLSRLWKSGVIESSASLNHVGGSGGDAVGAGNLSAFLEKSSISPSRRRSSSNDNHDFDCSEVDFRFVLLVWRLLVDSLIPSPDGNMKVFIMSMLSSAVTTVVDEGES